MKDTIYTMNSCQWLLRFKYNFKGNRITLWDQILHIFSEKHIVGFLPHEVNLCKPLKSEKEWFGVLITFLKCKASFSLISMPMAWRVDIWWSIVDMILVWREGWSSCLFEMKRNGFSKLLLTNGLNVITIPSSLTWKATV